MGAVIAIGILVAVVIALFFCGLIDSGSSTGEDAVCHSDGSESSPVAMMWKAQVAEADEYYRNVVHHASKATSPIPLVTGEHHLYSVEAVILESRRVRTGTAFAGPTISIPLVRTLGLRLRAGYFAHAPMVSNELVPVDAGTITVTDRRLVFSPDLTDSRWEHRTRTIRFVEITQFVPVLQRGADDDCPKNMLIACARARGRAFFICSMTPGAILGSVYSAYPKLIPHKEETDV